MYASDVTTQAVQHAAETFNTAARAAKQPLWEPTYHNRRQIDHAIAHFEDLYDQERQQLRRALTPKEHAFIQNERRLCALDFRGYWLPNYAWIVDWKKQPQRFTPNVSQQIIMDLWGTRERAGQAIWMLQLKARRLGVSTVTELAVGHRFQFHPYSNCVVASADPDKSVQMAGIIAYCLERQPWWLLPSKPTKVSRGIPAEYGEIHTALTIQAGNQFNGVARGSTPNVVHLSELCEWDDAENLVDGALMRAVIDTPDVFGILESTAMGVGNYLHKTWEQTKKDAQRGRARMMPLFLPWYVGTDLYPSEADLRARPIEPNWQPADRTVHHAERAREYVINNPLLLEHLAKGARDWRMPREQMWFREMEYETARDKKQLNIFLSEMPADDFEAFQSSNIPVVDQEVLLGYRERTRAPIAVYTVLGPGIPESLTVSRRQYDTSQPSITVKTRELLPRFDAVYQFVPLQFHGYPDFDEACKLLVWEWPEDGQVYGIGVDTSDGIGQDNSVIEVMREATPTRAPGQVAEFAYDYVKAQQLWPLALAVSAFYSAFNPHVGRRTQAKLAIECRGNGETVQYEIQKRGWSNFHVWKRYDNKQPTLDVKANKIGIYTNLWFRSLMMDMLLTSLDEEAIDIPSPYLVQELTTLERDPEQQKAKAAYGAHDDRVMALGFPLFSLHVGKAPHRQYARRKVEYAPGLDDTEPRTYPVWTLPDQARSLAFVPPGHARVVQRLASRPREGALTRYVNPQMPRGFR